MMQVTIEHRSHYRSHKNNIYKKTMKCTRENYEINPFAFSCCKNQYEIPIT